MVRALADATPSSPPDRGISSDGGTPRASGWGLAPMGLGAAAPPVPQGRVLVADDEVVTVDLLSFILRQAGYEVVGVTTCFQALAVALEPPLPDVILLDAMMPFLSGLDVCGRLRALPPTADTPIGIFSSADEADVRWQAVGADGFLGKPFAIEAVPRFVAAVRSARRGRPDPSSPSDPPSADARRGGPHASPAASVVGAPAIPESHTPRPQPRHPSPSAPAPDSAVRGRAGGDSVERRHDRRAHDASVTEIADGPRTGGDDGRS